MQILNVPGSWVDLTIGAADIASGLEPSADLTARNDSVTSLFMAAKNIGMDTIRLFGHGDKTTQLQTGPGEIRRDSQGTPSFTP